MVGIHPPTLASKARSTFFCAAAANNALPWLARSALFAVTTCLSFSIAFRIRSLAIPWPPIISTIISMSGSLTTFCASVVKTASEIRTPRSVLMSMSATHFKFKIAPTRAVSNSWFSMSNFATPVPTVPQPSRPIFIRRMCFCSLIFDWNYKQLQGN